MKQAFQPVQNLAVLAVVSRDYWGSLGILSAVSQTPAFDNVAMIWGFMRHWYASHSGKASCLF